MHSSPPCQYSDTPPSILVPQTFVLFNIQSQPLGPIGLNGKQKRSDPVTWLRYLYDMNPLLTFFDRRGPRSKRLKQGSPRV